MPLRVLIVAPEHRTLPRLAQSSELTRISDVRGVYTEIVIGPLVTLERIQQRLRRMRYDVLLWSGHGSNGRLLLPDDSEAEPRWLASEVRLAGIHTVILAACESATGRGLNTFTEVLPAAGINTIAMSVEVSDRSAVDYNVALLHALVNGESLREAHRIGREALGERPDANAPQLYPADVAVAPGGDFPGDYEETLRNLVRVQIDHNRRLDRIEQRMFPPWQVRLWQAIAALVVVTAIVTFSITETRLVFFNDVRVGVLLTAMALALAGSLWRMSEITRARIK